MDKNRWGRVTLLLYQWVVNKLYNIKEEDIPYAHNIMDLGYRWQSQDILIAFPYIMLQNQIYTW